MKINIKGNRESFYLTNKVENIDISLSGDFKFDAKTSVTLTHQDFNIPIDNRQTLFKLTEKVKGANLDKLILIFQDFSINSDYIDFLKKRPNTEIGLLKSVLLIYNRIESSMSDPIEMKLEKQIFNDFIIYYSEKVGAQEDVCFIDKKHINDSNLSKIQRLMDLNLLVRLDVDIEQIKYNSYFIPLIKPGIPLEYFKTEFDKSGKKTHQLWKQILFDRNSQISSWAKNRY